MKSRIGLLTCVFMLVIAGAVAAQVETTKPAETTALAASTEQISVSGKVVSSSSTELVIENDAGERMTFALDPATSTPTSFTVGERVNVQYHSASGGTVHQAARIIVEPPARFEPEAEEVTSSTRLPETATNLPMIGLLGLVIAGGAVAVRLARS